MKAVFLDFATLDTETTGASAGGSERGMPSLDPTPLFDRMPDLEIYSTTEPAQVAERIRDAEIVLANKTQLDAETLANAKKLRFIGLAATGADNVDFAAAADAGIAVTNIRAYCTQSVVEHVFGCLLALSHNLHRYAADVRAGEWQKTSNFCLLDHPIRELSAMTIGIVGYGVLGRAVSKTAQAFGMQPLIARRRDAAAVSGDGRVGFNEMLAQSDVITLHCPLDASTRHMMGGSELAAMKPHSILINAARGGLVDSNALVRALEDGPLAAAAIDVLGEEPPVNGDPLLDYRGNNLILTPHIAWATFEARQNAIGELAANVEAFLAGAERNRLA